MTIQRGGGGAFTRRRVSAPESPGKSMYLGPSACRVERVTGLPQGQGLQGTVHTVGGHDLVLAGGGTEGGGGRALMAGTSASSTA